MLVNKKEGFIFGVMMCFGMVCVMLIYNVIINGVIYDFLLVIVFEMVIGFIVVLLLDLLLVGFFVKKIVFSMLFDKFKKLYVIFVMLMCMVIGMVFCMFVFGLVIVVLLNGFNGDSFFSVYFMIVLKNFILVYFL